MPPIDSADLLFRLSGGAANTDPDASIGGAMSTVAGGVITSAQMNNLWDDVSGDEGAAGDVEYRCIYLHNTDATRTWLNVKLWISATSSSPDTAFAIALGGEGVGGTAESPGDEDTPPSGEAFSSPTTKAAGLDVGDLAAGESYPIWIRRTVTAGADAFDNDSYSLSASGDSGE